VESGMPFRIRNLTNAIAIHPGSLPSTAVRD
jgi:hypothetical protein